jgi:cell wall-associated NlpC family hydrolase
VNPSGALLILAGLWAVVQLVKGDALARLGLTEMGPARASTLQQEGPMVGVASSAQGSAAIQAVIRQALALQGTPYANPSNPPATLDCSSFVSGSPCCNWSCPTRSGPTGWGRSEASRRA